MKYVAMPVAKYKWVAIMAYMLLSWVKNVDTPLL